MPRGKKSQKISIRNVGKQLKLQCYYSKKVETSYRSKYKGLVKYMQALKIFAIENNLIT
jgi:hypothetical protein